MNFNYYGQSCFSVELMGKILLFDPFISPNPLASNININEVKADYIFVSHGHEDHVADLMHIALNTGAKVIGAVEVIAWFKNKGLKNTHEMNFGSFNFEFGKVSFVPALHSSSMPDGTYGGNPGGFVISSTEKSFYYSGDTCLTNDMQLIPHYAQLNFAVLPIGGNYTMDVDDAIIASNMIQCSKIIGVHYNTFSVITIDVDKAKSKFADANKELILPSVGEHFTI